MIIAALMMALAIVNTCKGESQMQYPRAIPRAIPVHPDELRVLPKLTAREWILNNTTPEYMNESFELALDEPLVTDVPYQAPHQYHPRYNDQMERMIRDPEFNNETTNNYQIRRVYSQGEFVGYIIVQVRESQAPVTVPVSGTTARHRDAVPTAEEREPVLRRATGTSRGQIRGLQRAAYLRAWRVHRLRCVHLPASATDGNNMNNRKEKLWNTRLGLHLKSGAQLRLGGQLRIKLDT